MADAMIKRTIELRVFTENGESGFDPNSKEQSRAIGYLATWAMMAESKPEVVIHIHTNGCIFANYYDGEVHKYQIYAMKDDKSGEYSFHS